MRLTPRATCFGHIRPSSGSLYVLSYTSHCTLICKYTDILYCHLLKLLNFINFVVYVDCVSKNVIQKMNTLPL
jgi:hypothetical protein